MSTISYLDPDTGKYIEIPTGGGSEPSSPSSAKDISYDGSQSGLDAKNVQTAIDEAYEKRFEPTMIEVGADLNDFLKPGLYYTPSSNIGIKNAPTAWAFSLEVIKSLGDATKDNAVIQRLTEYYVNSEGSHIFERHIYIEKGLFGDWFEIYTSVNPDPNVEKANSLYLPTIATVNADDLPEISKLTTVESNGKLSQNLPNERDWFKLLSLMGIDPAFALQIASNFNPSGGLFYRIKVNNDWVDWIKILTELEYGKEDISSIGDGTISGAIKKLSETEDYLYSIYFECRNNDENYKLNVWWDDDINLTPERMHPGERIQYIKRPGHYLHLYVGTNLNNGGSTHITVYHYDKQGTGYGDTKSYTKDSYGTYEIKNQNPANICITI